MVLRVTGWNLLRVSAHFDGKAVLPGVHGTYTDLFSPQMLEGTDALVVA